MLRLTYFRNAHEIYLKKILSIKLLLSKLFYPKVIQNRNLTIFRSDARVTKKNFYGRELKAICIFLTATENSVVKEIGICC